MLIGMLVPETPRPGEEPDGNEAKLRMLPPLAVAALVVSVRGGDQPSLTPMAQVSLEELRTLAQTPPRAKTILQPPNTRVLMAVHRLP